MTLRIGVIGTGAIGREHIHRITHKLKGAQVVAVNDVNTEQAQGVVRALDLEAKVYTTGAEVIQAADVDAVIVTSWGPTHEEFVLASIAAGKPVFCEKPLAVTAEGCRQIVEAEMAAGRKLVQVGFMRRFDYAYRQLKCVLEADTIGAPLILNCVHRNPEAPGFSGDMALTDSCVHEFDVLRWLLADDYISAQVIQPRRTRLCDDDSLQDPHVILLRTRQGVHISIESFVNCQYGYDIQCQVVGETGTANLPEPASVPVRREAKLSFDILVSWKDRFIDAFDVEFQEWIDATTRGEMTGPSAWDGYVVAMTSDACVKAKHSGQIEPIELPECPDFYTN
ncbi:Gfo/Idh/MocA family oxidoreductase [Halomonas heilongjiangensis]|uniref:Inositol 2-dehydrogenase n=1 Tax=Halomonas heilongjiangensis TaxID=1387883 RepID=A0A2N7TKG1_9GAMM|nr:Gfo/Idh/MocA family oxidoreductase [Halomonas heilongjiangensis]PMR68618.1 inositol 2-dehydrogenase [Halomonas heilongjiangensis]PXX89191.1 inositol 2-dehydrogenase [Halomonas heilongjiangensis]